ncbi:XrtA system polysaccharide chain length determinant [Aliiglaciecola sp. LCG003]|uniref:XrtA system polysaccharide chain length determinant n=1 Tax=Aliiglaciecola sp. LCG003 TaxID=3053655 RepID=UPI00257267F3|nr:XrtA system polysaccharide chain length determinant [Aliiglaciecola sp. LCG003]WJG10442.1 lipopolysaccharide biosynthesis [Aliiglaciecola sp. LCG003]
MLGIQEAIEQALTYVKGVWIKKRYIIISTWLICPIGWAYVASLPDQYASSARLFVDTSSLLRPLLRGLAVYNNPSEQVNLVARTLLSRPNLEKIAREADLDITVTTQAEMDELINEMRKGIKLNSTAEQNIYNISYNSQSPELAQKIVQITLNEFVESSLGSNRQSSDSAEEFINRQIEEYEQRLEEAEQRLAEFKVSRIDRAPGSSRDYYSQLQRQVSDLQATELRLLELTSQLNAAKAQLVGEAPVFGLAAPDSRVAPSVNTRYDNRIAALESRIDELLIQYTELHPEVVKTKGMLDNLYDEREQHIKSLTDVAEETGSYSQFGNLNQNPVYQELKLTVAQYESQIAQLTVRATQTRAKINELERIVDLVPQIEAEAQGLNRDYEITRDKYLELIGRREQAELSRKAEATSDDVQFRVIDPPTLPTKPSGPNRILYYSMILFVGFGAGLGIAFLVSQVNPVVLSPSQLVGNFGIPVFGKVSHINAQEIAKVDRRRMLVFAASSLAIVFIFIGLVYADIAYGRLPIYLLENLI